MKIILNWNKKLFYNFFLRRKNKVIGRDVFMFCRYKGKYLILNGLCLEFRSKNKGLLKSSVIIFRRDTKKKHFINFSIFLSGISNLNISGLTYGHKINFSKLSMLRYK